MTPSGASVKGFFTIFSRPAERRRPFRDGLLQPGRCPLKPYAMATIAQALALALDHHLAGRLAEAQTLYTRILDADPDQPDALHFLGVLAGQLGEHEAGLRLVERAIALRPQAADMRANHANILRAAGRLAEAAAAYRRAIALQPAFCEAWTDLATALRAGGDGDGAIHALERALAAAPGLAVAAGRLGLLLHERGRLLVEAGRGGEALQPLARAAELLPLDADVAFLLGNALYAAGRRADSVAAYRAALAITPDFPSAAFNLGIALGKLDRLEESAAALERAARLDPLHSEAFDNLVLALYLLDREEEANDWAERVLDLKDRTALEQAPADLPPLPAAPRGAERRCRNVLAFSLWGERELYSRGAVENARLTPLLYPGWVCRIYHDDSVPAATLAALAEAGAELVAMEPGSGPARGLYWRFAAADDPTVARFACRDCDSRISPKEKAAVDAWIASGRPFHVMRDHILHTEVMLGGMWGGVAGLLPPLSALIGRHGLSGHFHDQHFLRRFVWPMIRDHALIHDRTHHRHGRPFPEGPDGPYPNRVGDRVG